MHTTRAIYTISSMANSPFQPANGTEGEMFFAAYCNHCKQSGQDVAPIRCEIVLRSMMLWMGDPDYPKELVHNADGEPTCTAFEEEYKWQFDRGSARAPDAMLPVTSSTEP